MVAVIRNDSALTAELLRRCNSAYFGGDNPAGDVFEAVTRLGCYEVYRIVVVVAGSRTMRASAAAPDPRLDRLWQHSLVTAVAASVIAGQVQEPQATAFTAGLLHDVGKLVLASAAGPKYGRLIQITAVPGVSLAQAEREVFGFEHGQVGGRLLERWLLPEDVTAAVRHHHDLAGANLFARLAATVAFADAAAHSLQDTTASDPRGMANGAEAMAVLDLDPDKVGLIMDLVQLDLKKEKGLFAAAGR